MQILFQPALDTRIQFIHVFEHDCALSLFVEGQHGVSPELPHAVAESAAGSTRKQVAMKSFSAKGSRDCTIRADDPQIEAKLLHDGKSEGVASPRDYDDLDSFSLRPA